MFEVRQNDKCRFCQKFTDMEAAIFCFDINVHLYLIYAKNVILFTEMEAAIFCFDML